MARANSELAASKPATVAAVITEPKSAVLQAPSKPALVAAVVTEPKLAVLEPPSKPVTVAAVVTPMDPPKSAVVADLEVRLFERYRLLADEGNAKAQYNVAHCLEKGKGVAQDFGEAARFYMLAARQDHAQAQHRLGRLFEAGNGVKQDTTQAADFYRFAVQHDLAQAQHDLGRLLETGNGVEEDFTEAVKLFRLAAAQNLADGQFSLGRVLLTRGNTRQDAIAAVRLLRLAVAQGHAEAHVLLGRCYAKGIAVERDDAEAVSLYCVAAGPPHSLPLAQHSLGGLLLQGRGVEQPNVAEAARLFRTAAERGLAEAAKPPSAPCASKGHCAKEEAEAEEVRRSAEVGQAHALYRLGFCAEHGKGMRHNLVEAARYYRLAAEQNMPLGHLCMGIFFEKGRGGLPKDAAQAAACYQLAALSFSSRRGADPGADPFLLSTCLPEHRPQVAFDAQSHPVDLDATSGAQHLLESACEMLSPAPSRESSSSRLAQGVRFLIMASKLGLAAADDAIVAFSSRRDVAASCCLGCGATRKLSVCQGCRVAKSCDGECATRMWAVHRPNCREWKQLAAPTDRNL